MTGSQSGLYWQEGAGQYWHIYPANQADMILRTGSGNGGIMGTIGNATARGYVHWTTGNEIGLLDNARTWQLRSWNGGTEIYDITYMNDARPYIMYDRNNTGYYWNGDYISRSRFWNTVPNDSWFPYTNNWNYFRGSTYAWNAVWYDENNSGYYLDPSGGNRLAYLYHGVGSYNVGGWTSGRIQTQSTSDGHQYHPLTGNWGYIGTSGQYWWYMYTNNFVNVSRRETKRDITPLDNTDNLYEYVMNDIDKLKPSMYKYKVETDILEEGNEPKYRPQYHLGFILDETPDYLQDQAFSGIDVYSVASLGVAAAKYNREEIKKIKQGVGLSKISDFGVSTAESEFTWVNFDASFAEQLGDQTIPVITVTPHSLGADLAIVERNSDGFRIRKSGVESISFDWIAMAKVPTETSTEKPEISEELRRNLEVNESDKARIKQYWAAEKLKGEQEHARQKKEQEETMRFGKENYEETVSPESIKEDDNYVPASKVEPAVPQGEDPSPMRYEVEPKPDFQKKSE
jgi:hypothetical protein